MSNFTEMPSLPFVLAQRETAISLSRASVQVGWRAFLERVQSLFAAIKGHLVSYFFLGLCPEIQLSRIPSKKLVNEKLSSAQRGKWVLFNFFPHKRNGEEFPSELSPVGLQTKGGQYIRERIRDLILAPHYENKQRRNVG